MKADISYKFFKEDFKRLCELYEEEEGEYNKLHKKNELFHSPKQRFHMILADYISYIDAVVSHVIYEKDFREYGAGIMPRDEMEYLNKRRIDAHNRALRGSITLFEKDPYIFYLSHLDLTGKHSEKDFSPSERSEMGDFMFRIVTVMASLTENELEEFGFHKFSDKKREKIDSIERANNIIFNTKDSSGNMPGINSIYSQIKGER